ncbi:hypothetical protein KAT92_04790 [Candidatus Babeliales bacterium]|nr:hypothetical protein [Candidatus Babeliales bacterium]
MNKLLKTLCVLALVGACGTYVVATEEEDTRTEEKSTERTPESVKEITGDQVSE